MLRVQIFLPCIFRICFSWPPDERYSDDYEEMLPRDSFASMLLALRSTAPKVHPITRRSHRVLASDDGKKSKAGAGFGKATKSAEPVTVKAKASDVAKASDIAKIERMQKIISSPDDEDDDEEEDFESRIDLILKTRGYERQLSKPKQKKAEKTIQELNKAEREVIPKFDQLDPSGQNRLKRDCSNPMCDGFGHEAGGVAALGVGDFRPFYWWPIKPYKPCQECMDAGMAYIRIGQNFDDVKLEREPTLLYQDIDRVMKEARGEIKSRSPFQKNYKEKKEEKKED
jgi:hypothetical protein